MSLSEDPDDNYQQFFSDAMATGCVWGLQSPEGWAICESEKYPDTPVLPFWSQPEYASAHQKDDWAAYELIPIALDEWLDEWLPGMHDDVLLVGVNWDDELLGIEKEPLDILEEFERALQA